MILIPQQGKFSQPGNSDLFGNLWYTKNMNFDEEGYAKLSSRTASLASEKATTNFKLPVSFGRTTGTFYVATILNPYVVQALDTGLSIAEDTDITNPQLANGSWGRWFQNLWHVASTTKIWSLSGTTWSDTGVTLAESGRVHALEVFANKSALAAADGNTVKLFNTSYATLVTLTIPVDFEIIGLAYSNAKMGVATMMSNTAAGQNNEAYFFIWDGASSQAGQGYPVGSDTIMSVKAYKSSWILLTRTGELKYFNGGGFDTLATLPLYHNQATWGDAQTRETYGDVMQVEGDVIYFNIGNNLSSFGRKGESYIQNHPSGVLCYDPKIGLYHRYSPSLSTAYYITVLSAGVNTGTDVLTADTGTIPATGNPIKMVSSASALLGGVNFGKVYFVIKHDATTFSLAETKDLANAGVKLDITSANNANFVALDVIDYGASKTGFSGGVGIVESRKEVADHLIFGSELYDYATTTKYDNINITIPKFKNIGYFTTAKITSQNIEDTLDKVYIKHRPLTGEDRIIVKYKDKDVVGLPTSTPQYPSTSGCSWVDSTNLLTASDLSEVVTYLASGGECEVEIISGSGAGQMAQVASITGTTGAYNIQLSETVDGATSGNKCDIIIDNWKLLKTTNGESYISSTNTRGYEEFPIATSSKWAKFKVELRGYETTIEEFRVINKTHTP